LRQSAEAAKNYLTAVSPASRASVARVGRLAALGRICNNHRPASPAKKVCKGSDNGEAKMSEAAAGPTRQQIYKVALASIVGSVIEQYDFLVTGVIAATVWPDIFFKEPGLKSAAAAIGTYGLGIIIRPVGAYIFGYIADRYGRKDALVYALVLMGLSTLAIGLTPTYASIGASAPVLLVIFRLLQGISFGAEFGTASTWVVEQAARSKYRAFWGAWVGFAIPIGLLLGFGSVILVKSLMTPADFNDWGWRIFFFIGFLVAIVGLIIRTRTMDSFIFEQHKNQIAILQNPALQVWKEMPTTILRTSLVNAMFGGAFFLYFVFGTNYMKQVGFTGTTPEIIGLIAAAFMLVFMIIGSLLADHFNRRTILLVAAIVFLVFAVPNFYLISTGNFWLATLGDIIGFGFVFGFGYGAIPTFYTENFPTRYRASGASAGYQIAQVYGGGLIPIIAGLILAAQGVKGAYPYIGGLVMAYAVAAIIAILLTPETKGKSLEN
jgi:MFS family permease